MTPVFRYVAGSLPLLISVPHDGREIPAEISGRMTRTGVAIPDTDWHVEKLYRFGAELGAHVLVANYSRYVVDLNRPPDNASLYEGQVATGLCPETSFSGKAIYSDAGVAAHEVSRRVRDYWQPYHDQLKTTLASLRDQWGYALLWDAHSIPGEVPRLFDGALPVLSLGSDDGRSCRRVAETAVNNIAAASPYSNVLNGRFKGGYITRNYGDPQNNIDALQLEISQRAYMNERTGDFDDELADALRDTLQGMLAAFLASIPASAS